MSTYVAQGIAYYLTHPRLWAMTMCPLLLTLVVAIGSVIVLFAAALYPQAEGLAGAGVPDVVAWILAIILVILEIFVVTFIYSLVILPCYQDRVFEYVMEAKGFGELVHNEANHSSCGRMCNACCRVSVCMRLVLLIVSLPLNLIPIVGTMIYLWLNGYILGWEHHLYYFELKGYAYADQKELVEQRRPQYSSFGAQALFLEMIPGVGPLFLFTNTVGAALFAADIERETQTQWSAAGNDPNAMQPGGGNGGVYGTNTVAPKGQQTSVAGYHVV